MSDKTSHSPTKKLRPITVIVPMPPSSRGGTEEYAYQLAKHFSGSRPVRIVTTSVRWGDPKHAISIGSASLERLEAREVWERPMLSGRAAWNQLRKEVEQAGIVQLHMPFPIVERRVTRWARKAGVPTVLTYHMDAELGVNPQAMLPRSVSWAYREVSALPSLRDANVIISNSWGYARASPVLSKFLPKVRVIYQGVDDERLRQIDETAVTATLPPRRRGVPRISYVGRLVPYKGLPGLLRAAARLKAAGRPFELLIGGRGPQASELHSLTKELGLESEVRFLGFVPDSVLGAVYRDSDVVVCHSVTLLESTPITLQEAMSFGTPVVGTTLPGTEETIPNDGIHGRLVRPHDIPGLADAIAELIDNGRPSGEPTTRVWADTAKEYLHLFDELLGPGRAKLLVPHPVPATHPVHSGEAHLPVGSPTWPRRS